MNKGYIDSLISDADAGNVNAQLLLGIMYQQGQGVQQDFSKAFSYFDRVAEQKNDIAQYNLGLLYYKGQGVNRDAYKALNYFHLSADQNNPCAQNILGLMYLDGSYLTRNSEEAHKLFSLAAKQNYADACNNLACMYQEFHNETQENKEALNWLYLENNIPCLNIQNKWSYSYHELYASKKENDKEALTWFERAAELGSFSAQYNLGCMYYYGYGVNQDFHKAFKYFKAAAEQDNSSAQYNLGLMYAKGLWISKNSSEALKYFELAAYKDNVDALYQLGFIYYSGKYSLVPVDTNQALIYFERAAMLGDANSWYELGLIHYKNNNYIIAQEYFNKAAGEVHVDAMFMLGVMSLYSAVRFDSYDNFFINSLNDLNQSFEYFMDAAKHGHEASRLALVELCFYYNRLVECYKSQFLMDVLLKEAEKSNIFAQYLLGVMHLCGLGVNMDHKLALKYSMLAVQQNPFISCERLINSSYFINSLHSVVYHVHQRPFLPMYHWLITDERGVEYRTQSPMLSENSFKLCVDLAQFNLGKLYFNSKKYKQALDCFSQAEISRCITDYNIKSEIARYIKLCNDKIDIKDISKN